LRKRISDFEILAGEATDKRFKDVDGMIMLEWLLKKWVLYG
jgi:hypothetical protein